jgi:lipopolysaccharide export system protein LptC
MIDEQAEMDVGVRMRLRRHLHFGSTRSHSRFVQRSRWILPSLAVSLLLLVGAWPQIQGAIDRMRVGIARIDLSEARNLRMVTPRYSGIDRENRPYVLTATAATQSGQGDDIVTLDAPKADMTMNSGSWVQVTSYTGTYQPQPQLLDLYGDVELYQDHGNEFHTDSAHFDIADGTGGGDQPVNGHGPFGHVTAQGFTMTNRGDVIVFTGKTHLTLLPRPKDVE